MTPLWQIVLPKLESFVFWSAFLLVLYTYVGYPLLAASMAKWRPKRWLRAEENFSVSLIMPVHNGAEVIQAKMEHLLQLDPNLVRQIIVISDGSTDGTAELLENFRDPRLKVLQLTEQVGKAEALNQAMLKAEHEILVFVDIRPRLEEDSLRTLIGNFADRSVGCVAGELIIQSSDRHDATAAVVGGAYWRYEQWIRTSEAWWDSPVGVYGGFYAVRRRLSRSFPPGLILDDMFQPLTVVRQGYRNVLDRSATVVDTWPESKHGEFQRKVRTLAGNFQLIRMAPWVLSRDNRVRFQFISHKLLRLLVPYALVVMVAISWALAQFHPAWGVFATLQMLFWIMAAISLRVKMPILRKVTGPASALLMLNVAAVVGLFTFLFTSGPLWKIWSPSATLAENHVALWGGQKQS